ncbi:MAG: hypothetical protein LUD29_00690 [Clostridia bacterium]|nr:hypothetical protein [Clostridia bacterium]
MAWELAAHGFDLYYFDNRDKCEVDFLINGHENLSALPLKIKFGKDHTTQRVRFLRLEFFHSINRGIIFSSSGT